jgi:hypothetical protein
MNDLAAGRPADTAPAVSINADRLWQSLMTLAQLGATAKGGVCRLALTELDRQARDLVVGWTREAGCAVRIDAIAWRCGTLRDADYDAEGVQVAAAVLGVLGFQHFALAVGTEGVELVPTEAVASNTMIFSVGASFLARADA